MWYGFFPESRKAHSKSQFFPMIGLASVVKNKNTTTSGEATSDGIFVFLPQLLSQEWGKTVPLKGP